MHVNWRVRAGTHRQELASPGCNIFCGVMALDADQFREQGGQMGGTPPFSLLDPNWANAVGAWASAAVALVALLVAVVPGPVVIQRISVLGGHNAPREFVRQCMPDPPDGICWESYVGSVQDESMAPGEEICLLALRGSPADAAFAAFRDRCRASLADLTLEIHYTDIYRQSLKLVKPMRWFGRQIALSVDSGGGTAQSGPSETP